MLAFLFVLFIITLNSNSYAYTWEEFLDYCEQTKDMGTYNDTNKIVKYIANNKTFVDTQVRRFINPDDYNNFLITSDPTSTWQVCFYNGTLNYTISGNNLTWTNRPSVRTILQYTFNNTATDYGNQTLNNQVYASLRGIMQTPPQNNSFGNFILQNKLTEIILLIGPETEFTTDNLPWLLAQIKVQSGMDDTGIGLYLNNEKVGNFITYGETYTNGNIYTYGITSTTGLISGGTYNIRLYDTNNNLLDISEDFILEWTETGFTPSGTITNQSGDITGNIDLSGIETQLGNINNSIISGDIKIENAIKNLESGEQARDNFWRNTYNSLFTLSSGDVDELYNELEEVMTTFEIYNDLSGERAILEELQESDPRRF